MAAGTRPRAISADGAASGRSISTISIFSSGRAVAIVRAAMNLSSWPGVRDREEDV
jgi:hypothetical protein